MNTVSLTPCDALQCVSPAAHAPGLVSAAGELVHPPLPNYTAIELATEPDDVRAQQLARERDDAVARGGGTVPGSFTSRPLHARRPANGFFSPYPG